MLWYQRCAGCDAKSFLKAKRLLTFQVPPPRFHFYVSGRITQTVCWNKIFKNSQVKVQHLKCFFNTVIFHLRKHLNSAPQLRGWDEHPWAPWITDSWENPISLCVLITGPQPNTCRKTASSEEFLPTVSQWHWRCSNTDSVQQILLWGSRAASLSVSGNITAEVILDSGFGFSIASGRFIL